jgi:hypothetical protein
MSDKSDFDKELEKLIAELSADISEKEKKTIREYMREYNARPEVKKRTKAYWKKPENKDKLRKYLKEYNQRPEVKNKRIKYAKAYHQKPEVKARLKEYYQTPEVKEKRWEYNQKKKLKNQNTHEICRLIGKLVTPSQTYDIKCNKCSVAYPKKEIEENYFIRKNKCPCCKYTLKIWRPRNRQKPRVNV